MVTGKERKSCSISLALFMMLNMFGFHCDYRKLSNSFYAACTLSKALPFIFPFIGLWQKLVLSSLLCAVRSYESMDFINEDVQKGCPFLQNFQITDNCNY